uniref:Uncharacterized protein n=1 Tax=Anguilla anguilla TaxID=7936 RepID=A0A0E9RTX4_ANGAN
MACLDSLYSVFSKHDIMIQYKMILLINALHCAGHCGEETDRIFTETLIQSVTVVCHQKFI